jgi:hypothetical protein
VRQVLHDERKQRAENTGTDTVEDLHSDQQVRTQTVATVR